MMGEHAYMLNNRKKKEGKKHCIQASSFTDNLHLNWRVEL
jgi:hypothetical protein